ncbi:tRNA (guanosine(37)-N1)-methyltransferase TrmD, partial [Enterobacter hormaechei]|nr:tRNA (guanosine(37)-N1)-methyltransferase TrmD [Citrobacter braakii]MCE1631371.1 tRNA (guanosine(37)-N1)-methyltransferase TrmD [Enterobacter hormaechei]
ELLENLALTDEQRILLTEFQREHLTEATN